MKKYILLFLLIHNSLFSQVISGNVYDKTTEEILPGASVYIDGTTIGVTTNFKGYFELDIQKSQNASIIISFVGYETQAFSLSEFSASKDIFLIERTNQLNEVELGLDIWSREKKIAPF